MSTPRPGVHALLPGQTPEGKYILAVLLKRTYKIVPFGLCERVEEDRPLLGGDEHYGDPLNTPPRFEADFKAYLNTNAIRDIAGFAAELAKQADVIRDRIDTINDSLRAIDYNPGRYIRLEMSRTPNSERCSVRGIGVAVMVSTSTV